jgi:hypothetical protein
MLQGTETLPAPVPPLPPIDFADVGGGVCPADPPPPWLDPAAAGAAQTNKPSPAVAKIRIVMVLRPLFARPRRAARQYRRGLAGFAIDAGRVRRVLAGALRHHDETEHDKRHATPGLLRASRSQ